MHPTRILRAGALLALLTLSAGCQTTIGNYFGNRVLRVTQTQDVHGPLDRGVPFRSRPSIRRGREGEPAASAWLWRGAPAGARVTSATIRRRSERRAPAARAAVEHPRVFAYGRADRTAGHPA